MIHEFYVHPESYKAIVTGRKKFDIRISNVDFKVGDTLYLRELDLRKIPGPVNGYYTGRVCYARIDYVLFHAPGIEPGYCILSITHLKK